MSFVNRIDPKTRPLLAAAGPALFAALALGSGGSSLVLSSGRLAEVLHDAVGPAAAIAVVVGIRVHQPRPSAPWVLVACSVLLFGLGDVVYTDQATQRVHLILSLGDWLSLAACLLMVAALTAIGNTWVSSSGATRLLYVDSAMVFVGAFLLLWFFVFNAEFDSLGVTVSQRTLTAAYPTLDILMLALGARFLLTRAVRLPSFALLLGGVGFGFVGDLVWRGFLQDSGYGTTWVSASYYACYALLGAAALHPSMRKVAAMGLPPDEVMPWRRLALPALSLATIPLVVLVHHSDFKDIDDLVIFGVAATLIPALVAFRLTDLVLESHRLAARAQAAAGRLAALVDASPLPVAVLNPDGDVVVWNGAAEAASGWSANEIVGRPWLPSPSPGEPGVADFRARALAGERFDRVELGIRRRDGLPRRVEVSTAPVRSVDNGVDAVVAVFADVTEERRRRDQLVFLAERDALTGLLNRRAFNAQLLARMGDRASSSRVVAMVDVDNFKLVNDTVGHSAGDEVLRDLAGLIDRTLRPGDLCARLSGDEFALLLDHCTVERAVGVAERLLQSVRDYSLRTDAGTVEVTVSIGLCHLQPGAAAARSVEESLVRADTALYEAKAQGRNRVVAWTLALARNDLLVSSREWSHRLKAALADGRFVVHLQPIVDVHDGTPVYREALTRMLDEEGNLISPAEFFPHAHRLGITEQIDVNAIELVVELLERDPALPIFVNLDPVTFDDDAILDSLERMLAARPRMSGRFGIEITERTPIRDYARAQERLAALRSLGCLVAIDDFGTDFSSFEHLRRLPADLVKVGNGLVENLADPVNQAFLGAVVAAAHALSKRVIAEGIEDAQIAGLVRQHGVELAQGFFYGRPEPSRLVRDLHRNTARERLVDDAVALGQP